MVYSTSAGFGISEGPFQNFSEGLSNDNMQEVATIHVSRSLYKGEQEELTENFPFMSSLLDRLGHFSCIK